VPSTKAPLEDLTEVLTQPVRDHARDV